MRALVTCELTEHAEARLRALGYDVVRAGWGRTRRPLKRAQYVAAAQGVEADAVGGTWGVGASHPAVVGDGVEIAAPCARDLNGQLAASL